MLLRFSIGLRVKDKAILEKFQESLGVGHIYPQGSESVQLRVESIKEIDKLISHFEKYPLKTKK